MSQLELKNVILDLFNQLPDLNTHLDEKGCASAEKDRMIASMTEKLDTFA